MGDPSSLDPGAVECGSKMLSVNPEGRNTLSSALNMWHGTITTSTEYSSQKAIFLWANQLFVVLMYLGTYFLQSKVAEVSFPQDTVYKIMN